MYLRISSPEKEIYTGEVTKVTIPTEVGEITVLPEHQPLISIVKAGLLRISPEMLPNTNEFVTENGQVILSVSKGLVYIDGKEIVVTTAVATTSPQESADVLEQMRIQMQEDLEKIKLEGNEEDLEEAMINLEKITADIRLAKMKYVTR